MGAARATVVLLAGVVALAASGCGEGPEPAGGGAADQPGRELFVEKCGGCHALDSAGTSGSVGPPLDDTALDAGAIARRIEAGGGPMPARLLEGGDKRLVAKYVAELADGARR